MTLEETLKLLTKYRVARAKLCLPSGNPTGPLVLDVEIELHPSAFAPHVNNADIAPTSPPAGWANNNPTDEQVLHMSGVEMTDEELKGEES